MNVKRFQIILAVTLALLGGQAASAQRYGSVSAGYAATAFSGADCSNFLSSLPLHGFYAKVEEDLKSVRILIALTSSGLGATGMLSRITYLNTWWLNLFWKRSPSDAPEEMYLFLLTGLNVPSIS